MTKEIARLLVLAQAASDEGKGKVLLSGLLTEKLRLKAERGYPMKDIAIHELVKLISKYPQKDIHFYVCEDVQCIAKYIVYFDIHASWGKMQISFHSFDRRLKEYLRGSRKSHTEWASWQSSRENAYELARKYELACEADYIVY